MCIFNKTCLAGLVTIALISTASADVNDEMRLRNKLETLQQKYDEQWKKLFQLEARLDRLEFYAQKQGIGKADAGTVRMSHTAEPAKAIRVAAEQGQRKPATTVSKQEEEVVKEAPASRSARTVVQEQHTLFERKFTLEPGFTYTAFDRNQLVLNGFLALDAIFLGNISVDEVEAQILTLDLTGRYGITDRSQLDFNIPVLYRDTNYQSVGAGGASTSLIEENVTLNSEIGDVSVGYYYQLFKETASRPDVVWNVRVKAPTGSDPYGIRIVDVPGSSGNLSVPEDLPSGNGVWALSSGFSFAKTVDPAIFFANINYTHNFSEDFNDISSADGRQPGEINLGDSISYGFGIAFALSERASMSFGYSQQFTQKSEQKLDGFSTVSIIGSDANVATMNIGATYALSDRSSWATNVGIGLNTDAPDVTFSMKFPYTF